MNVTLLDPYHAIRRLGNACVKTGLEENHVAHAGLHILTFHLLVAGAVIVA